MQAGPSLHVFRSVNHHLSTPVGVTHHRTHKSVFHHVFMQNIKVWQKAINSKPQDLQVPLSLKKSILCFLRPVASCTYIFSLFLFIKV